MENKPRRAVRITVIGIIFIAGSCLVLLVCGFMFLIETLSGGSLEKISPRYSPVYLLVGAVWGVGMLVSSIGLLKRKNAFRILFIILWILPCAAFVILGVNSILNFSPTRDTFSIFEKIPGLHLASTIANIAGAIAVCVLIILLVVSPKVSADFKSKKEPSDGAGS